MKLTTLFRLRKPDGTDPVNIEDFNDNFDVIDEELGKRLESTGSASDMTTAFTQASTRTNLKTGEKISVSFGKIMKWFADLKAVAFSGSYSDLSNQPTIPSGAAADYGVANNCTTTQAGSVLDARQGKVLQDQITQQSSELKALGDRVPGLISKYLIKTTVDSYGLINLGTNYEYIAAVGIGDAVNDNQRIYNLRVNKIFKNQYGIWYAEIYQDNGLYTNTDTEINLFILLAAI